MNKDQVKGNWHEVKGKVKEKWGKLTDDDLMQINGRREQLLGALQKKYGYVREKAETELSTFERTCSACQNQGKNWEESESETDVEREFQKTPNREDRDRNRNM